MRISATGTRLNARHSPAEAGFSLIELMVVLFIMALMTGVVMWTLPTGNAEARAWVERFSEQVQVAADQSAISGAPIGVRLTAQGYSFYRYRAGAWEVFDDRSPLAGKDWPEEVIYLGLRSQGSAPGSDPAAAGQEEEEDTQPLPQIRFDAIGPPAPFEIELQSSDILFSVRRTPQGVIGIEQGES